MFGHVLTHSITKTHVPVVTVELIWLLLLNILSFNFVPIPNKFLRLKRFRKSYVNRPDVLTDNTRYTAFLLDVRCAVQCGHVLVHLRNLFLLSTPVARMLLTPRWASRQKDLKNLSINLSRLTVGVKHSISLRATFSLNPHLVEEVICFPFFAPPYGL